MEQSGARDDKDGDGIVEYNDIINVNNVSSDTDTGQIWDTNEGYTPLAALALAGGSDGLFSLGPMAYADAESDDGDDDNDNEAWSRHRDSSGAFFANWQAITIAASRESSQDEEDKYAEDERTGDTKSAEITADDAQHEANEAFLALADQALLALEDDYRLTLQGESSNSPCFSKDVQASCEIITAVSSTSIDGETILSNETNHVEPLPSSFASDFDAARAVCSSSTMHPVHDRDEAAFAADFSNLTVTSNMVSSIDTDKVRQVVQNLKIQRSKLQSKLVQWERQQLRLLAQPPLQHSWIPENVCRSFRRAAQMQNQHVIPSTEKETEIEMTQKLSRAATLAHAIHRLDLASFGMENLVVHIVGCDGMEVATQARVQEIFHPLITWMRQPHARKIPRALQLHLIGPNLSWQISKLELMATQEGKNHHDGGPLSCLESVQVSVHSGYYHEWRESDSKSSNSPDLLLAFHPGFWGYETWKPTLEWLVKQNESIPFVATSYTLMEAEDDQEVLEGFMTETAKKLWEAEFNPFASQCIRPTATAVKGEEYRENATWQAWRI